MNRPRLARLDRALADLQRRSRAEAEAEARALVDCVTEAELEALITELEALITEAGGTCTEAELWAAVDESRAAGATDAELAATIFDGRPDLLATCRARLDAYKRETAGQSCKPWIWDWLRRKLAAGELA